MPIKFQRTCVLLFALMAFLTLPEVYGQKSPGATGSVCTGAYNVFTPPAENLHVYMTVSDSDKFYFNHPETVVLENLDLHKTYIVRIFDGDTQTNSWKLRFDRLKVHRVTIWRSPGYWHMDPNPSGQCGEK